MKRAFVVAGLLFGDEGKGSTVDYLTQRYGASLVVRYNGASQAMHNVCLKDGRHHTFQIFGSGTLAGAETWLSQYVRVDPYVMIEEAEHLATLGVMNPLSCIFIDERCLMTTPWHRFASEAWGNAHKGTVTGMGVWETRDYAERFPESAITWSDLYDFDGLRMKASEMARHYSHELALGDLALTKLVDVFCADLLKLFEGHDAPMVMSSRAWKNELAYRDCIVFEGAQGIGLDEHIGFKPYITSSNTTAANAYALLDETHDFYDDQITSVGCTRMYATRHGLGHFPTEEKVEFVRLGIKEAHNPEDSYQGLFRYGWLDLHLLSYTLGFMRNPMLSLSHLDQFDGDKSWLVATKDRRGDKPVLVQVRSVTDLMNLIETELGVSIAVRAYGPNREDRYNNGRLD